MARPRMSDAEREAKRQERSRRTFSDAAYQHYDTSNGYGSKDEWEAAAEAAAEAIFGAKRFGWKFFYDNHPANQPDGLTKQQRADLETLMLSAMPVDIAAFKRAYKNVMLVAHPDHGGSHEQMVAVNAAVERLVKFYK